MSVPPRAQRLYAIWRKLGAEPMSEAEFDSAVLRALDRGPGGEADADAMRFLLVSSEAVTATNGDGGVVYRKAARFPEHPPNGPGTAAFDQQIREQAEHEQADHDRLDAEIERKAPQNRERQELDVHITAVVRRQLRAELPTLLREVEQKAEQRGRLRGRFEGQKTEAAT